MQMKQKRIFVGNLPPNITRDELKQKFGEFGNVLSVEIKSRLDSTTFAFLDVEIDLYQLDICFKTLTNKIWNGKEIKLELAKESFLSRLQREREQNDTSQTVGNLNADTFDKCSVPESLNLVNNNAVSKYKVKNDTFRNDHIDDGNCNDSVKKLDQDVEYNGKLRMFSGSKSLVSEEGHKPKVRLAKTKTERHEKGKQTLECNSSNKPEKHVLAKFQSYSDVWKDSTDGGSEVKVDHPGQQIWRANVYDDNSPLRSSFTENICKKKHSEVRSIAKERRYGGVIENKNKSQDSIKSEEKRIKALIGRSIAFTREKKAIAQALVDVDSKEKFNKKILYNSDDEEDGYKQIKEIPKNKQNKSKDSFEAVKPQLFSDEELAEEEDGTDFKIKEQFEGKKGHKLLKMQSRYGNDRRFALDERFQDKRNDGSVQIEAPIEDERKKQMEILESVVGHSICSRPKQEEDRRQKRPSMLRFDPTKPEHAKYEIKRETNLTGKNNIMDGVGKKRQKRNKGSSGNFEDEEVVPVTKKVKRRVAEPVSKDKFYHISDSLKDSFKNNKKEEFSLLRMFGAVEKDDGCGNEDKVEDDNHGALSQFDLKKKLRNFERFSTAPADLGDKDDAHAWRSGPSKKVQTADPPSMAQKATKQVTTVGVRRESFFFAAKDDRLKESLDFLKRPEDSEGMEKFRERRADVKRTFHNKIRHNSKPMNNRK